MGGGWAAAALAWLVLFLRLRRIMNIAPKAMAPMTTRPPTTPPTIAPTFVLDLLTAVAVGCEVPL